MELSTIQLKLKERLALGLNYGLQSIEDTLVPTSLLKNEIVTYKSQYNDLNRIASQGILGYEQVEIGYNKIRQGLLEIIDKLAENDLENREKLPELQNRELQNRKENFFELLKIHTNNLESIEVALTSYGEQLNKDIRKGREAIRFLYHEIFKYNYHQPGYGKEKPAVIPYTRSFFTEKYPRMEVYMKTLGFILKYVQDEEVEQGFFLGVVKSILSSSEQLMLFYYAISGIEPGCGSLLISSGLLDENISQNLLEPSHFELLKGE